MCGCVLQDGIWYTYIVNWSVRCLWDLRELPCGLDRVCMNRNLGPPCGLEWVCFYCFSFYKNYFIIFVFTRVAENSSIVSCELFLVEVRFIFRWCLTHFYWMLLSIYIILLFVIDSAVTTMFNIPDFSVITLQYSHFDVSLINFHICK